MPSRERRRRRAGPWLCVLIISVSIAVAGQERPDYSGEWVLLHPDDHGPELATTLVVTQTVLRESIAGKPLSMPLVALAVERRFHDRVRSTTYHIGRLGGTVGGVDANGVERNPTQTRFSYTWQGDSIVIEEGTYSGPRRDSGSFTEQTEVWSLDREKRLSIATTKRSSGDPVRKSMLIYVRRQIDQ